MLSWLYMRSASIVAHEYGLNPLAVCSQQPKWQCGMHQMLLYMGVCAHTALHGIGDIPTCTQWREDCALAGKCRWLLITPVSAPCIIIASVPCSAAMGCVRCPLQQVVQHLVLVTKIWASQAELVLLCCACMCTRDVTVTGADQCHITTSVISPLQYA